MMKKLGILAAAVVGTVLSIGSANASSIQASAPVVDAVAPVGGFHSWDYVITLTSGNGLTDGLRPGETTKGSLFVFYDLDGLAPNSGGTAIGWVSGGTGWSSGVIESQTNVGQGIGNVGSDPPTTDASTTDDGRSNVRFNYTSTTDTAPGGTVVLGTVRIWSSVTLANLIGFLARDTQPNPISGGSPNPLGVANNWITSGPRIVPVPAAAWMGLSTLSGLGVLGLMKKRRR